MAVGCADPCDRTDSAGVSLTQYSALQHCPSISYTDVALFTLVINHGRPSASPELLLTAISKTNDHSPAFLPYVTGNQLLQNNRWATRLGLAIVSHLKGSHLSRTNWFITPHCRRGYHLIISFFSYPLIYTRMHIDKLHLISSRYTQLLEALS